MEKWFEKQSRLVQIIILLIPFVNWVVEICVRWSHALRKGSLFKYLIAILVTFFGLAFGCRLLLRAARCGFSCNRLDLSFDPSERI